jgi:hypothetical protein
VFVEIKVLSQVYPGFHLRNFPATAHHIPHCHLVKENKEALVVATKEIGLEVNAHKSKYVVISRDKSAGQSHSM